MKQDNNEIKTYGAFGITFIPKNLRGPYKYNEFTFIMVKSDYLVLTTRNTVMSNFRTTSVFYRTYDINYIVKNKENILAKLTHNNLFFLLVLTKGLVVNLTISIIRVASNF